MRFYGTVEGALPLKGELEVGQPNFRFSKQTSQLRLRMYSYGMGYSPPPPLTRKIILHFCLISGEVGSLGKYLREGNYPTRGSLCHCVFPTFYSVASSITVQASVFWVLAFVHARGRRHSAIRMPESILLN